MTQTPLSTSLAPSSTALSVCFIGGGNMAAALIGGVQKARPGSAVTVVEPLAERRDWLLHQFKLTPHAEPGVAALAGDLVLLAVKPQQMREVCASLQPLLQPRHIVVSIAAGIRAADLGRWLATDRVVRAMPNTPALIGQGITGLTALPGVTDADRQQVDALLGAVGRTLWLKDDDQIDAVTAVSGSGPAYVFWFIESLAVAAESVGLSPEVAQLLALHTVHGAAQLAAQSSLGPATLRAQVTSKGGTTAAALGVLQAREVQSHLVEAVQAAYQRGRELGDQLQRTA